MICLVSVKMSTVIAIGYVFLFIFLLKYSWLRVTVEYVLLFAVQRSDSVIHNILRSCLSRTKGYMSSLLHVYFYPPSSGKTVYNRALGDKDRKRDPGLNTGIRRQSPRRNCKHRREGFRESGAGPGHRGRPRTEYWPVLGEEVRVRCGER